MNIKLSKIRWFIQKNRYPFYAVIALLSFITVNAVSLSTSRRNFTGKWVGKYLNYDAEILLMNTGKMEGRLRYPGREELYLGSFHISGDILKVKINYGEVNNHPYQRMNRTFVFRIISYSSKRVVLSPKNSDIRFVFRR